MLSLSDLHLCDSSSLYYTPITQTCHLCLYCCLHLPLLFAPICCLGASPSSCLTASSLPPPRLLCIHPARCTRTKPFFPRLSLRTSVESCHCSSVKLKHFKEKLASIGCKGCGHSLSMNEQAGILVSDKVMNCHLNVCSVRSFFSCAADDQRLS